MQNMTGGYENYFFDVMVGELENVKNDYYVDILFLHDELTEGKLRVWFKEDYMPEVDEFFVKTIFEVTAPIGGVVEAEEVLFLSFILSDEEYHETVKKTIDELTEKVQELFK